MWRQFFSEQSPLLKTVHSDDPIKCAEAIIDSLGREVVLATPIGIGKPNRLINTLYRIAEGDRRVSLKIFTGISLARPSYRTTLERRFVEPLLDRLFPNHPDLLYVRALRAKQLPPNIQVREFFLQAGAWLSNPIAQQGYTSLNYSHVAGYLTRAGTNAFAQLVAPNPHGDASRLSLSSNTDVTLDLAPYINAQRKARRPIMLAGEINANLPYMPGEAEIDRGQFDVLLEAGGGYDLFAPPKEPVSLSDFAMALYAATLVRDGGTLQIGIGSFSDALAHALVLRHTRNSQFRNLVARLGTPLHAEAELEPFDIGLYGCTEMLVDGFLALRRAGILKRRVAGKDGRKAILHAGFFVGNHALYSELRDMPAAELAEICMTAISFTNTLHGETDLKRAQRPYARFINTAMVATLLGAVSSDQLEDGRVVSGPGGQHDLVTMAHELDGARSIIAVRATRRQNRTSISNIVWRYANATVPRALRDIIVTEYGIADLRGKSDRDTVVEMINVADSAFQSQLIRDAQRSGKLESGFTVAPHAAANRLERIEAALGPARREGLLPVFPLGTEMTDVEQSLAQSLLLLKSADYLTLARAAYSGVSGGPPLASELAMLDRLRLGKPAGLADRFYRLLVLGTARSRSAQ
jgi:acyl-CoA hydrolase